MEEEIRRKWEEGENEGMRQSSQYKEWMEARKPRRRREEMILEGMVEVTQEEEMFLGDFEQQCLSVTSHHDYHYAEEHILALPPFLQIVGVVGVELMWMVETGR